MSHQHLQTLLDEQVPLVRAMGVKIKQYGPEGLLLTAPLERNVNHRGTAFAGSLATLATLAGWALTMLRVEAMGMHPEVVVAHSTIDYLAPVRTDIEALCAMPDKAAAEKLQRALQRKGIGRWTLAARIPATGAMSVEFTGTYAITLQRGL
ncbi:MAG: YiiD C-terminal domain-containing protein [Gammaproteobacteria bacterium]